MSKLLTADEVKELTGYEQPSRQSAWLRKEGIKHFQNSKGRVIVPAAALLSDQPISTEEPDFSQFDAA